MPRLPYIGRITRVVEEHGIDRRIQVIAEVHANRPNRRPVSCASADRMRIVVETARPGQRRIVRRPRGNRNVPACGFIRLPEILDALEHVPRMLKHIAHIVKQHERNTIPHQRQRGRRQPQLNRIHDRARSSDRVSRRQIARPRVVDPEPPMGGATAHIQPFRQRNRIARRIRVLQRARAIGNPNRPRRAVRPSKGVLKRDPRTPRKNILFLAKRVVGALRKVHPVEIRIRAKNPIRQKLLRGKVHAPPRIQGARIA